MLFLNCGIITHLEMRTINLSSTFSNFNLMGCYYTLCEPGNHVLKTDWLYFKVSKCVVCHCPPNFTLVSTKICRPNCQKLNLIAQFINVLVDESQLIKMDSFNFVILLLTMAVAQYYSRLRTPRWPCKITPPLRNVIFYLLDYFKRQSLAFVQNHF